MSYANQEELRRLPDGRIDITQFSESDLRNQRQVIMDIDEWCREEEANQVASGILPPGGLKELREIEAAGYRWDKDLKKKVKVKKAHAD